MLIITKNIKKKYWKKMVIITENIKKKILENTEKL